MLDQQPPNTTALIGVDNQKRHFRLSGARYDVAPAADDSGPSFLFSQRYQRHVLVEVDVYEERDLPVRKTAFDDKETALQRLASGPPNRRKHIIPIRRMKRANFDVASVAKSLNDQIFADIRHCHLPNQIEITPRGSASAFVDICQYPALERGRIVVGVTILVAEAALFRIVDTLHRGLRASHGPKLTLAW